MRRRTRRRLARYWPTLDAIFLLTMGGISLLGLYFWSENYLADLAIPIALVILYATLRRT